MASVINNYEAVVIVDVNLGEEGVAAIVEKMKSLIEANGTLENVDEWGKRRMAYQINDMGEGYYVLYTFSCEPGFPAEFDRVCNITEGVLRSMVVSR